VGKECTDQGPFPDRHGIFRVLFNTGCCLVGLETMLMTRAVTGELVVGTAFDLNGVVGKFKSGDIDVITHMVRYLFRRLANPATFYTLERRVIFHGGRGGGSRRFRDTLCKGMQAYPIPLHVSEPAAHWWAAPPKPPAV
jgi:hypothetical protein